MFLFVSCPLDELNRREKARGDRNIGNAESQFIKLMPTDIYDFVVNTYDDTTEKCAELIIEKHNIILNDPSYVTAFESMYINKSPYLQSEKYQWIRV